MVGQVVGEVLEAGFIGLLAGVELGVDVDGDVECAEVLFDEREDFFPIKAADACCEAWKSEAGETFFFCELVKGAESVVHVLDACFTGF